MLETLKDLPGEIVGLKAQGTVTKEDYERVFLPLFDGARREGKQLRLLYELGPEFEGLTASAAWEDAKLGLGALRLVEGCAVVTDIEWIRQSTKVASFVMPCPVGVFSVRELKNAVDWLEAIPRTGGVTHRLLADKGVIVVEVTSALRSHDFDALAATADTWIESHGSLQGVVIHARAFPGWENLGSLIRHVQFVRDHHQHVRRVALSADGSLTGLLPRIGEHFVKAEVNVFPFDALDAAVAWAAGS
jgi:hypothetical protein